MRVIIVGAGIGGLATALRLHHKGVDCEIYSADQHPSRAAARCAAPRGARAARPRRRADRAPAGRIRAGRPRCARAIQR
ncbi:NAD(P)-binding protein [Actinomadura latina]|uniref:NAD(P)-binding protein n=1 Tax=Actinomadura latina TaxID=163603 RepID=UPI001B351AC0